LGKSSKNEPLRGLRELRGETWITAAAIVLIGLYAYWPSFSGVLLFDDRPAIVENQTIRSLALPDVLRPPAGATVSGRPVANVSFALNYALAPADARDVFSPAALVPDAPARFQRNVWGYHLVNLLIHLAAALTLFGVVRRTLESPRLRERTGRAALPLAAIAAIVWAVHPLDTMAVTYVVQRVESLMALFYLLTLYCAIRAGLATSRRGLWTAGAIVACALGLGTKETMVSAPIAVWLWDVVFEGAPWAPWRHRPRRLLYTGLAATWTVTIALLLTESQAQLVLSDVATYGASEGWTPWSYLWTQAGVLVHYIRLAFVPAPLVFDYYGWPRAASPIDVLPQAALVISLIILTVVALARRRPAGFAGAVSFLVLAPTSSVLPIPTEIASEHRMYLPVAAIVALVVVALYGTARRLAVRPRRAVASVLVLALIVLFTAATRARNRDYSSDETLWRDTVRKRPDNARARLNYTIDLMATARYAEAEAEMRRAIALPADRNTRAQSHLQLGAALCAQGKLKEGIASVEQGLAIDANLPDADVILAQAYSDLQDIGRALPQFRRALQRAPDNVLLLLRFTWLAATSDASTDDDRRMALTTGERAAALTSRQHVGVLEALGAAYARNGRFGEAIATARAGLALAESRGDSTASTLRAQIDLYERAAAARGGR
jgi:protein O-mannosyl-transferase